jgi:hypothetical protein
MKRGSGDISLDTRTDTTATVCSPQIFGEHKKQSLLTANIFWLMQYSGQESNWNFFAAK